MNDGLTGVIVLLPSVDQRALGIAVLMVFGMVIVVRRRGAADRRSNARLTSTSRPRTSAACGDAVVAWPASLGTSRTESQTAIGFQAGQLIGIVGYPKSIACFTYHRQREQTCKSAVDSTMRRMLPKLNNPACTLKTYATPVTPTRLRQQTTIASNGGWQVGDAYTATITTPVRLGTLSSTGVAHATISSPEIELVMSSQT